MGTKIESTSMSEREQGLIDLTVDLVHCLVNRMSPDYKEEIRHIQIVLSQEKQDTWKFGLKINAPEEEGS